MPLFNSPSREPIVRHELPTGENLFPHILLIGFRRQKMLYLIEFCQAAAVIDALW
jgi:hypothetical protein